MFEVMGTWLSTISSPHIVIYSSIISMEINILGIISGGVFSVS